ncbi:MAG TPA: YggS family pyridoxal phosphate-dependent enzyme [Firmicutes bacterium]|nr:YggS family pyridoxal phosphate-dependent enzyme [Bacillota bacterium]
MSIQDNLNNVYERIGQAAKRSGRAAADIQLLGVTKFASAAEIEELMQAGLTTLGENRVQQAVKRIERFPEATWHFIGSLQTNKVRFCENFALIHSLDRWRLARQINRWAKRRGRPQEVLIQVNTAGEETKHGLKPESVPKFVERVLAECPYVKIRGLMMMAPYIEPQATRPFFRKTKELYDKVRAELDLDWDILSMGMTNDFEVAVEEGATLVRIGSALFAKEE